MSNRRVVTLFADEADLLAAVRTAREKSYVIVDVHTPYAVHGLEHALGARPSRLSWACFAFGLAGAAGMLWFQFWASAVDWPLNVGGRPWNSLPAFVPVVFEAMVLCGGLGMVATFLIVSRLFPGRREQQPDPRVSDDRFALVLDESDAAFDLDVVTRMFKGLGAVEVREIVVEEAA